MHFETIHINGIDYKRGEKYNGKVIEDFYLASSTNCKYVVEFTDGTHIRLK